MRQPTPTIHLNGTTRDELIRQNCDAAEAVRVAIQAVRNAQPNGRDYYPQGDGAIDEALRQHRRRMQDLEAIERELMEIAENIAP